MPKGNRQSTASSLRTTSIWAKTIGQTHAAGFGANEVEVDERRKTNKGVEGDAEFERMKAILRQSKASRDGTFVDDGRGKWKGKRRLKGQFVAPTLPSSLRRTSGAAAAGSEPGGGEQHSDSDFSSSDEDEEAGGNNRNVLSVVRAAEAPIGDRYTGAGQQRMADSEKGLKREA